MINLRENKAYSRMRFRKSLNGIGERNIGASSTKNQTLVISFFIQTIKKVKCLNKNF